MSACTARTSTFIYSSLLVPRHVLALSMMGMLGRGFICIGFFLWDKGIKYQLLDFISLVGRKFQSKSRLRILATPDNEQCSVFSLGVNAGPLSPRLLPQKWALPTPRGLSAFRLSHLKSGYFFLVPFLCLLKLSSQKNEV